MLKKNLKASSLANAIFLCVLISVFLGCLVLISHYSNILNAKIELNERLINSNTATFTYYSTQLEVLDYNTPTQTNILENNLNTIVTKKRWGYYDILSCQTIFKTDTITKTAMLGLQANTQKRVALYLTNYDKTLKLSGETSLIGNLHIPNAQIENYYLNGRKGNKITVHGSKVKSEKNLPKVTVIPKMNLEAFEHRQLDTFNTNEAIVNTFNSETIVIDVSNISTLNNLVFKGNLILYSNHTINISANTILTDVIIYAKNVSISTHFSGTLHIVAQKNVTINTNVELKYPSSIFVEHPSDSLSVSIKEHSKIAGGIVIQSLPINASKNNLSIEENAEVYGTVYCMGRTQLKGSILGSLYTNRFYLKTKSANYENVILNGSIDGQKLPNQFVQIPLFNSNPTNGSYQIVKDL